MAENSEINGTNGIPQNGDASFINGGVFYAPEGPPFGKGGPEYAEAGPTFAPEGPAFGNGGPEYAEAGPTFASEGPAFGEGGPSFADQVPNGPPKIVIPNAQPVEAKLTKYMSECLDKVALAEGFQTYSLNIEAGSSVGDGFVGILFKVTIIENNSDKQLCVVVKAPPENIARRRDFGAMELFEREVYVYNVVLPEFVQFQEENRITKSMGFFNFPKCYFAEFNVERDDSLIIMEDLRTTEHKMWDKFVPTNYEHTKLFVASLGRFHAVSFAMKQQRPEQFAKFKQMHDKMTEKMMSEQMVMMMHSSIDRAVATLNDNEQQKKNKILNVKDNFASIMKELVNGEFAEPFSVIGHGDCWSNNVMYKYKRGRPESIVFLDWQLSRYCSPVLDLVYFFFTCTDQEMRAKHFDELLGIYHRSLKDLLDHLGGDTMSQFPFTAFLRQMKLFGKYGFLMSTFLLPMVTTKNEDLPDMDFIAENMNNDDPAMIEEMMAFTQKENLNFTKRMRGSALDALKYGYF